MRSSATGPFLPPLRTRIDTFDMTIASTVDYLRMVWPAELSDVIFEVAPGPASVIPGVGVERFSVDARERRITLYRLPMQRLSRMHQVDELHQRMIVESCVFRAVAELLGKDPWDLAPDRFRRL
ncbi:metallopeptidase family protein [Cryobacterium sp. 1639]|uniref:metallopeptidase family protein n=1 Tax=Cryobacterium inferilacus TaxID=2866629 RepID=UPI0035A8B30A